MMSLAIGLALAFLRRRWGQALLSLFVGALGVAAVEAVLIADREIPAAADRAFGHVDLVIGPKGAALDLVLCCVLHVAEPRGLVPLDRAMAALHQPAIRAAAPIALGDNYRGVRIVGTQPAILEVYRARLAEGHMWSASLQAVLGAEAAHQLGLKIGDRFVGSHGLGLGGEVHAEFPYTVTGILAPTGSALDRLILTDVQSVYDIHRHHEVEEAEEQGLPKPEAAPPAASAVVAAYRSPAALASVPRLIDAMPDFSAASPSLEAAKLLRLARPAIVVAIVLGLLFIAIAAANGATALTALMGTRIRDLALLRALGAPRRALAGVAIAEAALLAFGAVAIGLGLAIGLITLGAQLVQANKGLAFSAIPQWEDIGWLVLGAAIAAVLAGAVPAVRAARAPIEAVLSS